jgi:arabinogalactan endo-1,4-beta-galactosidase
MKKLLTIAFGVFAMLNSLSVTAQDYFVGGDISVLQSYEDLGVDYYDQQGAKIDDVLKYMKSEQVGWNAMRVRLFVNPQRKNPDGSTDAQVCQDLDYVVRLCQRIKEEGFALMLDFHYSDTWADPSNQWTPADWQGLSDEQLQTKLYDYTKDCLQQLVEADAAPDFIQTGNEISYGMLWGKYNQKTYYCNWSDNKNWPRFIGLLQRAVKACREVCPEAKVILHTERAGQVNALLAICEKLNAVDYDIIGLSYYPFWHGALATLGRTLSQLESQYPDKEVQIVETAYYYQWQPTSGITDFSKTWEVSPEGQAAFARSLIAELKNHDNVNGLYWWFPEENGNGPGSKALTNWVNRGLWDNSSHRALPGLYVLKEFLNRPGTGILMMRDDRRDDQHWYNLQGMRLDSRPQRHGLFINNGKKYVVR